MIDQSRIDIYDYLYGIFYDVVTKNVYSIGEPQELTKSDVTNGFIVIRVGDLYDESEFSRQAYATVRCFVTAYIPPTSRGRLDYDKYTQFETDINDAIVTASQDSGYKYHVEQGSILSTDGYAYSNANNTYYTFIKSFIINIL